MTAIFQTKFVGDIHHNGETVEVLNKTDDPKPQNVRYTIRFPNGEITEVYPEELVSI